MNTAVQHRGRPQSTPRPGQEEVTSAFLRQTIFYPPATAMTRKQLWGSENVPEQYKTVSGNQPIEETFLITEIAAFHNVSFTSVGGTASTAALAGFFQQYFENHSSLLFERTNKKYSPVLLTSLLPYDAVALGTTVSLGKKAVSRYKLPDPIVWDGGQNVKFYFEPALGCVTAAAGTSTPIYPEAGLASNQGYGITFVFYGKTWRP